MSGKKRLGLALCGSGAKEIRQRSEGVAGVNDGLLNRCRLLCGCRGRLLLLI